MQHVTTPLEITAAAWRVAGFMMETNLRVATVFGQAAIETNPFATSARLKAKPVAPKAAPKVKAKAKPKTSKPAAAQSKEARAKVEAAKPAPVGLCRVSSMPRIQCSSKKR